MQEAEIIDSKDLSVQLTISKPSIEDLFKDSLNEIKGFKRKISLKVLLSKMQRKYRRRIRFCLF